VDFYKKNETFHDPAILPLTDGLMDVWIDGVLHIGFEQNAMYVTLTVTSAQDSAPVSSNNPAFHLFNNPNRKTMGHGLASGCNTSFLNTESLDPSARPDLLSSP
jgi:hypothetical protein